MLREKFLSLERPGSNLLKHKVHGKPDDTNMVAIALNWGIYISQIICGEKKKCIQLGFKVNHSTVVVCLVFSVIKSCLIGQSDPLTIEADF